MPIADRVRQILSTRGLTLYQVSQRSAELFGSSSLYFIPQRLYQDLAVGTISPNIHQLAAFSRISNYRLSDWLAVFGFRLDDIPRLQLLIPWRRTVLLDSTIYDQEQWVPWFVDKRFHSALPTVVPLRQVLESGPPRRARELLALNKKRFLYVKVGREDAFAFPTLVPGSIARIDVTRRPDSSLAAGSTASEAIFLVENGLSLHCGHLRGVDKNRIMLCATHFPFSQVELKLGRDARILGMVNAEIRPVVRQSESEIPRSATQVRVDLAALVRPPADLHTLLRTSRMRVGLSFRGASTLSRWIGHEFADDMYFAAPGTLSDYENLASPLHHVQKILSLCILYCIDFWTFLRVAVLPVDSLGNDPLSDEMIGRAGSAGNRPADGGATGLTSFGGQRGAFLPSLIDQWEELPLFIKGSLSAISRLKDISLSDIFWVRENQNPTHPRLAGATLVAVNRRAKTPPQSPASTVWEQPIYMLVKRDGAYLCGTCVLQHGVLILRPQSEKEHSPIELRNGIDAEVVGQVTMVLRRLS
jgi:hypothetical protein